MALPKLKSEFDVDAYMAWEEDQPERHEYLAGEVFAMSGGTDAHYTILGNAYAGLRAALSGLPQPEEDVLERPEIAIPLAAAHLGAEMSAASRIAPPAPVVCDADIVEESPAPLAPDSDWCGTRLMP